MHVSDDTIDWFYKDEEDDMRSSWKNGKEARCNVGNSNAITLDPEKAHEIQYMHGLSVQL